MARIVSITLRQNLDDTWSFGVVRDNDYKELTEDNIESIQEHINALVEFANSVKTEEQKKLEEVEKEKEQMLKIITEKTTDEEKLQMISMFSVWSGNAILYKIGDYLQYNNKLYKVIQDHTSQTDWSPDRAVSLFVEVVPPGAIAEFKQPTGAQDAYNINDRVIFEGYIWCSIIDNNVWSPTAYPQGWEKEREV